MSPVVRQFLLESWLVPVIIAGVLIYPSRWISQRLVHSLIVGAAIILAVGTTYVLAFGWPGWAVQSARHKVMLSTVIAATAGLIGDDDRRRLLPALLAALSLIPIWIAWPVLMRGEPSAWLVGLPMAAGLWFGHRLMSRSGTAEHQGWMLVAFAFGLSAIAAFAQTFSLAQLCFATASALMAILVFGRAPLPWLAPIIGATMVIGLATTMVLFTQASRPALIVLASVLFADIMADTISTDRATGQRRRLFGLFCILPTALSIVIARIDAGPISLY